MPSDDNSVVVTGGAGFIGSHIVEELVKRNCSVTVIDNLFTGFEQNIRQFGKKIKFVKGSVTDKRLLLKEFKGKQFILHLAAMRSVFPSLQHPLLYHKTNIDGTLNVLDAARKCDAKRVVFASSSSVYGNISSFPAEETSLPMPESPYAITKLAAENYCKMFYSLHGLETIVLRYFNVFGPRQNPKSIYAAVIPLFTLALLRGQQPTIYGSGEQSRDFTYVKNIVEANMLAMHADKALCSQVFNICSSNPVTVNELFAKISEI
ncbi:MAG: NAD-dependent epimerase/dehydratase family protein, partial [Candidatus Diapherotrites archaeon]|nr:NAD-dependent epimerase/dehydratase family protein [Candidatus Diapherotrites archaeon]